MRSFARGGTFATMKRDGFLKATLALFGLTSAAGVVAKGRSLASEVGSPKPRSGRDFHLVVGNRLGVAWKR